MNTLVTNQVAAFVAVIEQQAVPALRVGFTLAVIIFLLAGVFIWRRRHQFFDRDPIVENDVPVVRHNREEEILFVWTGLILVLLGILYQVWSA
jgi:phosphoglycerol transferase MdoB-like AlkP superfamily enzyme